MYKLLYWELLFLLPCVFTSSIYGLIFTRDYFKKIIVLSVIYGLLTPAVLLIIFGGLEEFFSTFIQESLMFIASFLILCCLTFLLIKMFVSKDIKIWHSIILSILLNTPTLIIALIEILLPHSSSLNGIQ